MSPRSRESPTSRRRTSSARFGRPSVRLRIATYSAGVSSARCSCSARATARSPRSASTWASRAWARSAARSATSSAARRRRTATAPRLTMHRRALGWRGRDRAVLEKPTDARASSVARMLNHINISGVFVLDQDEALDFYVNKLGLEVSNDVDLGFMRWLTVRVPGDSNREILLEKPGPPSMDEDAGNQIRELISKGASGFTVRFTTDDCRKTYEMLVERGVDITQEPTTRDYGTDIGLREPFGNHIRIVQPNL